MKCFLLLAVTLAVVGQKNRCQSQSQLLHGFRVNRDYYRRSNHRRGKRSADRAQRRILILISVDCGRDVCRVALFASRVWHIFPPRKLEDSNMTVR